MSQELKMEMLGRTDSTSDKNEYYFTRPNLPVSVDLSRCVIFFHPFEKDNGEFGGELIIKNYHPPGNNRRPPDRGRGDGRL